MHLSLFELQRRKILIIFVRHHHKLAVLLVHVVLAVIEVVADQLGVNTRPVITAELARLLHLEVEVEGPDRVLTAGGMEVPAVHTEGRGRAGCFQVS